MKTLRFLALLGLGAITPGVMSTATAAQPRVVIDFTDHGYDPFEKKARRPYEFSYNDWDKKRVSGLPGKGTLIQAPSGKGGMGENNTAVSFAKADAVGLIYVIGNGNTAKVLSFALTDRDGTEAKWTVPLEGKPKGQPQVAEFHLTRPERTDKPGKTPGLDLKKISSWQVQGDFQPANVEVLLVKLMAAAQ